MTINDVLGLVGLQRVPKCIGHWSVAPGGGLQRSSHQYGWQIIRKSRALKDGATGLDYFLADHPDIGLRLKAASPDARPADDPAPGGTDAAAPRSADQRGAGRG